MVKELVKSLEVLSNNTRPQAIAHAVCAGILIGFIPPDNLLWYVVFVLFLFMRIQRACYALCVILGALCACLLDPLFDIVGCYVLSLDKLQDFYVRLINIPFVAFTNFNNSIVIGSLLCGIVFYVPLFFLSLFLVKLWRKYVAPKVRSSKFVTILKQMPLISKLHQWQKDEFYEKKE